MDPPAPAIDPGVDASLDPILEVLEEPDDFARTEGLAKLLPNLDGEVARSLPGLLRNPKVELGNVESALLVRFWSEHDPEAASDWALFKSPMSRRAASIEVAFHRWALVDPQAAAQDLFAFNTVPGPFGRDAEIALVKAWFASGKPGLTDYIRDIGSGHSRQRSLATYAMELARRDGPKAALAWAESVPADEETYKKDVLRQTGSSVAMLDPVVTAAWCDRLCGDPVATNLRAMVAQRWAAADGPAAMEWLSRAPEGQERDWAVRSAFWGWWQADREGFGRWLESSFTDALPAWLDDGAEIYAAQLALTDPRRAIHWAQLIVDTETRERTLVNVARIWRRSDEAAADAWLETSSLSEEARDKVKNPVPGREVLPEPEEEG